MFIVVNDPNLGKHCSRWRSLIACFRFTHSERRIEILRDYLKATVVLKYKHRNKQGIDSNAVKYDVTCTNH